MSAPIPPSSPSPAPASSVPVSVLAALKAKKEHDQANEALIRAAQSPRQDSVEISPEAQALLGAQAAANDPLG